MELQDFIFMILSIIWGAGFLWAFSVVMKCRRKK
nr:MAG TPA: hypothetical protein [Caudoviricetes sp.]